MLLQHTIKSFVCRQGRMTARQQYALEHLGENVLRPYQEYPLDFSTVFLKKTKLIMEIGFGMGDTLVQTALRCPDHHFIGIEVHRPGIGSCLWQIDQLCLKNIIIIQEDALKILKNMILDQTLSRVHLYFPDPWPKKRHQKRRIIQTPLLYLLEKKLEAQGRLHIVTDCTEYGHFIPFVIHQHSRFKPITQLQEDPFVIHRPQTKFERRGLSNNNPPIEFLFEKI